MGKKVQRRQPVKQIVVDAATDASVKVKDNENDALGKVPINVNGKGQGKRARNNGKDKAHNHQGQGSRKDNKMSVKKAEELAKEGKFVVVDKHTNLILAILLSSLLSKTMTAVDTLMQKKKVPAHYRRRLREAVLDEVTGLPKQPRTALIKPLIPPTLPLDKIITVNVKAMDLNDDDKIALVADLQTKHNVNEAARQAAHNAQEAERQRIHNEEEAERKRMHFQRVGEEFEAYQNANARSTRTAPAPFTPTAFVPGPAFVPIVFVPVVFTPPEIKSHSFEIIEANGAYLKVPVPQVKEVRMPLGQAIQGLETKIFSSVEADEIFKKYDKEMHEYNRMVKNQETDEDNYLNTIWNCLSDASKVAMAAKLPGGKVALEAMYTAKQHGPLLDLIYDTHSNDNIYRSCSAQDKQAFLAAEQNYLSPEKMKQRPGESVMSYIERFKKYYDLSLQLVALCGSDWKHEESTWIRNVVGYSTASSLAAYKSALFNTDPLRGALDIQYKPTFIAQCEELVNMSQEASIGKLLVSQKNRNARINNKKERSKKSKEASDQIAMSTKVNVEPAESADPVKHFIDAKNIPPSVLKAIVRTRRSEVEKLISADSTEAPKTPKRSRGKPGPKKTSGKKNAKHAHNKTKQPRHASKDKHVHHTDFESPGFSSQSSSIRDDDSSDDGSSDDDEDVDNYTSRFTISRLNHVQCCQEVTPGLCKGPCCLTTRPRQERVIFSKAPRENFSANRLGMMAIDTASSINLLSKEHAGCDPIMPLRKPVRLNGVQGMKSLITHYFIHQIFGFCLLGDGTSILSYGMLTSMGYLVTKADHSVITLKHPKLKGVAPIVFHRTSDKLFVASDPTLVKGWERLTGKDRIGHFRSIVNPGQESQEQYKISFDEGDTYVDKGIHAVQIEAFNADEVLDHIKSDLARLALSTEVEGRLGGAKGCSPKSN